jgi:short chain dehydrogenase
MVVLAVAHDERMASPSASRAPQTSSQPILPGWLFANTVNATEENSNSPETERQGAVPYAMTKDAAVGLSLSLRAEAAAYGVRVTAVCSGVVETPILDKGGPDDPPTVTGRRACARVLPARAGPLYLFPAGGAPGSLTFLGGADASVGASSRMAGHRPARLQRVPGDLFAVNLVLPRTAAGKRPLWESTSMRTSGLEVHRGHLRRLKRSPVGNVVAAVCCCHRCGPLQY